MQMNNVFQAAADYFFELGVLLRLPRSGYIWHCVRLKDISSVALHKVQTAQVAVALSGALFGDHHSTVWWKALVHEASETRIGDLNAINKLYLIWLDSKAVEDQTGQLGRFGEEVMDAWLKVDCRSTELGNLVKDADYIQMALELRLMIEMGYDPLLKGWVDAVIDTLHHPLAREWIDQCWGMTTKEWWLKYVHDEPLQDASIFRKVHLAYFLAQMDGLDPLTLAWQLHDDVGLIEEEKVFQADVSVLEDILEKMENMDYREGKETLQEVCALVKGLHGQSAKFLGEQIALIHPTRWVPQAIEAAKLLERERKKR